MRRDRPSPSWNFRSRNRLRNRSIENRDSADGSFRLNVATEAMGNFRRAWAMVNASDREQRIWLGVAALIAICAIVSGALILHWGHRGPRSGCDVVGDMTLQWNSDVAPAKTALLTDPSQREVVLLVAGAEESFSHVLRASTRDLSSRSIQSALNRWADGLAMRAQSRRDAIQLTPTTATPNYGPAFAQASNDISTTARALSQECPAAELPRALPD
jgi:hypothetical protein